MTRSVRWFAIVISMAALAACSSGTKNSSDSTTSTTAGFPASAVFKGNATLTGAIDAKSPFSLDYHSASAKERTCAQVAANKGSGANFSVPFPRTVGPYKVTALTTVSPYKGPGVYGHDAFTQLEVLAAPKGSKTAESYVAEPGSTVRLEVKPNASGSFTFTGLKSSSGKSLSGSSTWTCSLR